MDITYKRQYEQLSIYMEGLLHMRIKLLDLVGFQSWVHGDKEYFVEYYFKDGVKITTAYGTPGEMGQGSGDPRRGNHRNRVGSSPDQCCNAWDNSPAYRSRPLSLRGRKFCPCWTWVSADFVPQT